LHLSPKKLRGILAVLLAVIAVAMIVLLIVDLTGKPKAESAATAAPTAAATETPTAAPTATETEITPTATETEASPVYVQNYYNGTQLDLTQYQGKVVLINYFTEWCPYCMEEMPDIKKALDAYDPNSLAILLVHPWDNEDQTNSVSVVNRFGLDGVTVLEDKDFSLVSAIGVPGYPTSVIVDQNGYLYTAAASMITLDWLTSAFDVLGVPLRGDTDTVTATPAP
jgi:thiol-disulfide isomerase/thioredoxin